MFLIFGARLNPGAYQVPRDFSTAAAILLGVLEGTAPDPMDTAMTTCTPLPNHDYTPHLKRDGLKGARIGIPRAFYYDQVIAPGETPPRGGLNPDQARVMAEAIEVLRGEGAIIVDPADILSVIDTDPAHNFLLWSTCSGVKGGKGNDANCSVVFKYGMKRDFNAWLSTLAPGAPVKTLTELRDFNLARPARGAIKYGQSQLDISDEMDLETDRAHSVDTSTAWRTCGGDEVIYQCKRTCHVRLTSSVMS